MNDLPNHVLPHRKSRRRKSLASRLFGWLLITALAVPVIAGGLWFLATVEGPLQQEKIVNIPKGSSTLGIADILRQQGVVDSKIMALLGMSAVRLGFDIEPKAGEYKFAAHSSLVDVLRKIKTGRTLFYKVSVPEGFTAWQVVERLKANDVLIGDISNPPAEGELLPDTYLFARGRTRQAIIDQMRAAQKKLMEKLWPARAEGLPFKTPEEALILASIVEKETGKADERAQVAAVFVNRMRNGMRLQSDPTIIYGITLGKGKLERPIRRSDIRQKTDYNTYQINGLPPTPIANPGRASIVAVLNPVETEHLYFVADGSGGHVFAKTLAQHNKNVRKWRSWLKDQRELQEDKEQETTGSLPAPASAASVAAAPPGPEQVRPAAIVQRRSPFRVVEVSGRSVPIPESRPEQ